MGIVFQALDDLLEATGGSSQTGEPVGKDRAQKLTFMGLWSTRLALVRQIKKKGGTRGKDSREGWLLDRVLGGPRSPVWIMIASE